MKKHYIVKQYWMFEKENLKEERYNIIKKNNMAVKGVIK